MCDLNCSNLIDLSSEGDNNCTDTKTKVTQLSEENHPPFVSRAWQKRKSLENNPFDSAQKQVDCADDPFDNAEKEASLKALQICKPSVDVKIGELLSLNDGVPMHVSLPFTAKALSMQASKELDLESPPILFNEKQTDSVSGTDTDSNPNSSAEASASAKLKTNMEYRKRLLKLSISNSSFSSPLARKQSLEFEEKLGTPISSVFSKAIEFEEHLLAAESPLKLVEDEDSVDPQNILDSEKNFQADLDMLKIPILNQLHSPVGNQISEKCIEDLVEVEKKTSSILDNNLPNVEAIKAKLKAKKDKMNKTHQQEISSLIENLKTLISSGEMVDNIKKQQANDLLETLSSALNPTNKYESPKTSDLFDGTPLPIERQSTFDMDLKKIEETNLCNQPLVKEMPNCMVSSSATYDGETPDVNLNLPEISPLSSQTSPSKCSHQHNTSYNECEKHLQNDFNDIIEQLGKFLINNNADNSPATNNNPTFIVVMNANQFNHSNLNSTDHTTLDIKQSSNVLTNYLDSSISDGSPDLGEVAMPRPRSQSLSIHDKIKIVQLPLQKAKTCSIQKEHNIQLPLQTTPPSANKEFLEFKTPPTRIMRRNSYSNGTPITTQVDIKRTKFGSENQTHTQFTRTKALDTHYEGQQAKVRPMSMPSNNLLTFKPDLKKRLKHNTESIIKSCGPLKATLPMKKVAPMLKISPPATEHNKKTNLLLNMSLQRQTKLNKMPTTPVQAKRSSKLGIEVDYPNACSTPSTFTSPVKRTTGSINKPRYSYLSVTPSPKSSEANIATSANLRRRTISELKSKSPLKSRGSSIAGVVPGSIAVSSSKLSTVNSRLSTSARAGFCKTPVKTPVVNTITTKPTTRLSSRVSVATSVLSAKNKENKRP